MQINMKVHASLTDFPIFSQIETFFKKFKEAQVDGLELVLGAKSRFEYARLAYLSEKYALPISSLHQPPWSGVGLYFDEEFLEVGKKLGVRHVVFHPLAFHSFTSRGMKKYFERLARLQEKWRVVVMLENMPNDMAYNKLHDGSSEHMIHHLEAMNVAADTYGFLLTYDVSHAEIINPPQSPIFQKLFPKIGNIHASSFRLGKHHLPFTMGEFMAKEFVHFLDQKKYQGLFTLEVYYPKLGLVMNKYDFSAIADSVAIVKKALDK